MNEIVKYYLDNENSLECHNKFIVDEFLSLFKTYAHEVKKKFVYKYYPHYF